MDTQSNAQDNQVYPQAIIIAIISALTIVLDIAPLVWHSKRKNIAVVSLIAWIIFLNFTNFINAIIWPNDDLEHRYQGDGLCDIEVKLFVGSYVGLSSALAAIMRNLSNVLNTESRPTILSAAQKRREQIIETLICWLPPVILISLHYIVQPNRYYLWGISGCNPSLDNSWLSVVLIFIWAPIFALIDAFYAALVIYRVHKYRRQFSDILEASDTTKHRFLRLLVMSEVLVVCFTPLQLFVFYNNVMLPHHPFSWTDVHPSNWSALIIQSQSFGSVLYDRWFRVACGVLVFLYFGMSTDAINLYKSWLRPLWKLFGSSKKPDPDRSPKKSGFSMSSRQSRKPLWKREFTKADQTSPTFQSTLRSSVTSLHSDKANTLTSVSVDEEWATDASRTIESVMLNAERERGVKEDASKL